MGTHWATKALQAVEFRSDGFGSHVAEVEEHSCRKDGPQHREAQDSRHDVGEHGQRRGVPAVDRQCELQTLLPQQPRGRKG